MPETISAPAPQPALDELPAAIERDVRILGWVRAGKRLVVPAAVISDAALILAVFAGLGRAAVLEGIRRCGALGATVAYVGTDKPFYLSFGFRPVYNLECWRRGQ